MSLRPRNATSAPAIRTRLDEVLEVGLQAMRFDRVTSVGDAPRGYRLHLNDNEREDFMRVRERRLTSSLLPFWLGVQGDNRTHMSREKIVRILADNGGSFQRPVNSNERSEEIVQEMMAWGRENESFAMLGYMEITRTLVGLGSTRARTSTVAGEYTQNESRDDLDESVPQWEWPDLMAATPDGFVRDVSEDPLPGLLEIKCPAGPTRHDVNKIMRFEDDRYIQVQAWVHMNVCREARFCDLLYYKRAREDPDSDGYVWLARLYKDDAAFNQLRAVLRDSFDSWAQAMYAVTNGLVNDDYVPVKLSQKRSVQGDSASTEKGKILAALDSWMHSSLKYRNSLDPAFPWVSRRDLELAGNASSAGLCQRYYVPTGEAYTHEGNAGTHGYAACTIPPGVEGAGSPLTARELWPREYVGSV